MRRYLGFLIALLIVAALVVPRLISNDREAAPAPAPAANRVLRVSVEEVTPRRLTEELATTGTVRANEQVEVVSEVSGKVVRILFDEGSQVSAGQLLLEIDASELAAERQRIGYQIELAERREGRQRELLDQGVISQDDYDFSLNELNVLRAQLRLVEAQLVKTEIRAPFAGLIGLRAVSLGSFLSSQTRIATLQDVSSVKLDFSVPEKYATRMRVGSDVAFSVKGSERDFTGRIYALEPMVDRDTRSLQLRARCPNPDGLLIPGAFADVRLVVQEVDDALTVPAIAVIPELGGKKVFVVQDGKAEPRQVTTGIRTEERVQITDGLAPGESVIVSAIQQLRPGLDVEVEES